jgi:cyanophycinase
VGVIGMALLGAGEFEPWSEVVDRWALERAGARGDGRIVIAPTASAPEGDDTFAGWARKGLEHFGRLGMEAEVLAMKTREDAQLEEVAERIRGASAVYFSGGNPYYLSEAIKETTFWRALLEELDRGAAYIGCSAGVAVLTETTYDAAAELLSDDVWKPGLGFVQEMLFAPHWNTVDQWFPGATGFIAASVKPGEVLVAQDEDTAMIGDGTAWSVVGDAGIHVLRDGTWTDHGAGDTFTLPFRFAR